MKLYGHGRVAEVALDSDWLYHFLKMNWSDHSQIIEVPLMGCNSTVDIKSMDTVEG